MYTFGRIRGILPLCNNGNGRRLSQAGVRLRPLRPQAFLWPLQHRVCQATPHFLCLLWPFRHLSATTTSRGGATNPVSHALGVEQVTRSPGREVPSTAAQVAALRCRCVALSDPRLACFVSAAWEGWPFVEQGDWISPALSLRTS